MIHTSNACEDRKYGRNGESKRIEERRMESVLNVGGQQADRFFSEVCLFR
jgi:hypothetical protein